MVPVLNLPARLVTMFLLSAPLLAQSIPNWTAPPFWTPSKGAPTAEKSFDAGELAIEAEGGLMQMSSPLPVVTVTPCRVVDTRGANGPFGGPALVGNASRTFNLPSGPCAGIPSNAAAYSLNFTVIGAAGTFQGGFLTAWPTGPLSRSSRRSTSPPTSSSRTPRSCPREPPVLSTSSSTSRLVS